MSNIRSQESHLNYTHLPYPVLQHYHHEQVRQRLLQNDLLWMPSVKGSFCPATCNIFTNIVITQVSWYTCDSSYKL